MPTRKPNKAFEMKKINGIEIRQRQSDGYIDAVSICDACDKDFSDYMNIRFTKRFLSELSRNVEISTTDLIQSKTEVDEIWVHPQVAINLSQWASPKLAVLIPQWVLEWHLKKNSSPTPTTNSVFVTSSGVKFEDIDSGFAAMIRQAAEFNPDK